MRIAGPIYYVGNRRVSCHLIQTNDGLILIDNAFSTTTYLLTESIRSLGFNPADIRILLNTHAHIDHVGAVKRLKALTGALVAIGKEDVEACVNGADNTPFCFEPFEADMALTHMDVVSLGGVDITCHHTPGHTKGTMTFTMNVEVDGKQYSAGLFGGPGRNTLTDEAMENNMGYTGNREDYANSLQYLKKLDIDIFLGAHPEQNHHFEKAYRLQNGESQNPYIDPAGWKEYILELERVFNKTFSK